MSNWDLQVAARTLWQEARGEPLEGQQAVAHVIVNRRASGRWGSTLASVCLWHAQFSGWNSADPNFKAACALPDDDPILQKMVTIVTAAESDPDSTHGAQFYYAASIPEPSWVVNATFCGKFGSQIFYKDVL